MSEAAFLRHRQVAAMNLTLAEAPRRSGGHVDGDAGRPTRATDAGSTWPRGTLPARRRRRSALAVAADRLVVVASSTGGPSALHAFVKGLPARTSARPWRSSSTCRPGFTASLAARLDSAGAAALR